MCYLIRRMGTITNFVKRNMLKPSAFTIEVKAKDLALYPLMALCH